MNTETTESIAAEIQKDYERERAELITEMENLALGCLKQRCYDLRDERYTDRQICDRARLDISRLTTAVHRLEAISYRADLARRFAAAGKP